MDASNFAFRPFGESSSELDYQFLLRLANLQAPQDPDGNAEWLKNRRLFDEQTRTRRHYIAVTRTTREDVGYACLEQAPSDPHTFRLYLVFDPNRWTFSDLGEFMYSRLLQDAKALDAALLVLVEYADDAAFAGFLQAHGFIPSGTGTFNGFSIVRMEKRLTQS